jgi:hypothetical protein
VAVVDLFQQRGIKPPGKDLFEGRGITPTGQPEQLGLMESFGQGAAQGATFGFADELYGVGAHLIPGGQDYTEATEAARARYARANPAAALAGELAGSLVLPGGAAKSGASLGARALRGALAGAVTGGVGAVGREEGNIAERAPAAIPGAALGAGFGGAGAAAAPAIAQGARRLVRAKQDQSAVQSLVETIARQDDIGEGAQKAVKSIQKAATVSKAGVTQAYDDIAKMTGVVEDKAAFELLSNKLGRVIDDEGVAWLDGGDRIIGLVDDTIGKLKKGATPADMDRARKLIAKVGRNISAKNPEEARILRGIKNEFDDWTFDVLTNKLYRGDEKAVEQIKQARGLATEYHRLFGQFSGKPGTNARAAGGIISKLLADDVEAESAINLIFGAHSLGVKGSRQALARIREVSPEAFEQLQAAHFTKLLTGTGKGDFLTGNQIAGRIERLNASGLAKTLYGDRLAELNRFGERLKNSQNVAQHVVDFVKSRPALLGFLMGSAGGATASGGDPTMTTFSGILGAAFSRGRGAPAALSKIRQAARPDVATTRRAGQVGGTLGGLMGPSLAGG